MRRRPPCLGCDGAPFCRAVSQVLAQKQNYLSILSKTTGHSTEKLDFDMQRPLYMQPKDALAYGIIDQVISNQKESGVMVDKVMTGDQFDKAAGLRPAR